MGTPGDIAFCRKFLVRMSGMWKESMVGAINPQMPVILFINQCCNGKPISLLDAGLDVVVLAMARGYILQYVKPN